MDQHNQVSAVDPGDAQVVSFSTDEAGRVHLLCIDGRTIVKPKPPVEGFDLAPDSIRRGPSVPGSLHGLALVEARMQGSPGLDMNHYYAAMDRLKGAGIMPTIHTDDLINADNPLGRMLARCGAFGLMSRGDLSSWPSLQLNPDVDFSKRTVLGRSIPSEQRFVHGGEHDEEGTILNFRSGEISVRPHAFHSDPWLGVNLWPDRAMEAVGYLSVLTAQTVRLLNGPRNVWVVFP